MLCGIAHPVLAVTTLADMIMLNGKAMSYMTRGYIVFAIVAAISVEAIAHRILKIGIVERIRWLGRESLFIYIVHMPIAGIVANICGRIDAWLLTLIRPIIVFGITVMVLVAVIRCVRNLPGGRIVAGLLGLRTEFES